MPDKGDVHAGPSAFELYVSSLSRVNNTLPFQSVTEPLYIMHVRSPIWSPHNLRMLFEF